MLRGLRWTVLLALAVWAWGGDAWAQLGYARVEAASGSLVNVREEPEVAEGNIVAQAASGTTVAILNTAIRPGYTWFRVQDAGKTYAGWIRGDLIDVLPGDGTPPSFEPATAAEATPAAQVSAADGVPGEGGTMTGEGEVAAADAGAGPAAVSAREPGSVAGAGGQPASGRVAAVVAERTPFEQRSDWSRHLIEYFPAIEGCVSRSSAQPARVLRAYPLSRGLFSVIVEDSAFRRWDCIVRDQGGTPLRFDPLSQPGSAGKAGRDPVFVLSVSDPPQGECYATEPVIEEPSGRQLGWLTYNTCAGKS